MQWGLDIVDAWYQTQYPLFYTHTLYPLLHNMNLAILTGKQCGTVSVDAEMEQ